MRIASRVEIMERGERHSAFLKYQGTVSFLHLLLRNENIENSDAEELSPAAVISVLKKRKREVAQEVEETRKQISLEKAKHETTSSAI
jgi:hypothetical protein